MNTEFNPQRLSRIHPVSVVMIGFVTFAIATLFLFWQDYQHRTREQLSQARIRLNEVVTALESRLLLTESSATLLQHVADNSAPASVLELAPAVDAWLRERPRASMVEDPARGPLRQFTFAALSDTELSLYPDFRRTDDDTLRREIGIALNIAPVLRSIAQALPDTPGVFYLSNQGFLLVHPPRDIDPAYLTTLFDSLAGRELLANAATGHTEATAAWSSLRQDQAGGGPIFTRSAPLRQQIPALVGLDISVDSVRRQLMPEGSMLPGTRLLLVNQRGQTLVDSMEEAPLELPTARLHEPGQEETVDHWLLWQPLNRGSLILSIALDKRVLRNTLLNHVLPRALLLGLMLTALAIIVLFLVHRQYRISRELVARLRQMAHEDELTALPNRRAFMDAAQMECQRALRRRETLGVLILDIDHFKQFNDRYGHATGDAVLQTVARVLQDNIREIDLIARLGGEEFAAIITHATEDDALIAAERLRLAVARQTFRPSDDSSAPLSISIGAYVGNPAQDTLDLMLVRADQALYDAKRAGRNQTAFYRRDNRLPTTAEPAPDIGL